MKISLVSDLHLDVSGFLDLPGGEVLILAGDLFEARELSKEFHQTKLIDRKPGAFPCHDFINAVVPKYEKVFYVMGNHEHYGGRFDRTLGVLRSLMPKNVTILEKESVEYDGVIFMGSTLWTDCNKNDPTTRWHIKSMMNDYRAITNFYTDRNVYHKLTPEFTFLDHGKSMQYFRSQWELNKDKPVVMITHHAPSFVSVPDRFKGDTSMNGGYASDLSNDILDNPQIKFWVHGHMHDPVDYMIGDTRILSNPRGYLPWEANNGFDPNFTFEINK